MTGDEATAKLLTLIPNSTDQEIASFLACSDDERAIVIKGFIDSKRVPARSTWDEVVAVLKACADFANLVIPIEGAISGVYGVVHPS